MIMDAFRNRSPHDGGPKHRAGAKGRRGPREAAVDAAVNGMRVKRGSGTGNCPGIRKELQTS